MVAKVTHGLKDFAQPFVVADVVADEECVTHVGSSFELNGYALRAMKKASLPCWPELNSALDRSQIMEYSAGKLPSPREVLATSRRHNRNATTLVSCRYDLTGSNVPRPK